MAKDAGMRYLVITSKHHDGFAMYGSKASKYNIVDATPYAKDPMKELSAACGKLGFDFGFYYSQDQDWHEASARAAGATDEIWTAAVEPMGHDELSPLEDQLEWLKEAGFGDVDCLFKDHFFAVTVAFRAE